MPDWLIEGNPTLLAVFAAVGLLAAAAWWKTRRRRLLLITIFALLGISALVMLDRFFESDREQIERKLGQMAKCVAPPRDLNKLSTDISADFTYSGHDKHAFRKFCEERIRIRDVREFVIWDFRANEISRGRKRAEVQFQFKARTAEQHPAEQGFFLCRATFSLDPDGQWRLYTFKVYPLNSADQAIVIPGLG